MKQIVNCGVLALLAVNGGCALNGGGPDESALNASLPVGVSLLESDREVCGGDVQVEESVASRARSSGLVLQRGQNATIRVDVDDDERLAWTCIADVTSDRESIECPTTTSHVRITRAGETDELLLECYG